MINKSISILMIDSTVGNEYSVLLSNEINNQSLDLIYITTEDRKMGKDVKYSVKRWMPSKNPSINKMNKVFKYFSYFAKVVYLVFSIKKVAIHFQFFRSRLDLLLFLFLCFSKQKVILTAHNILPHETKKIDIILYKAIYKYSSRIIVHSNYMKTKLLNHFKVSQNKISVVPHGDFDFYLTGKELNRSYAREIFKLNEHDKVILFFGVIRKYKGLEILLDAFDTISTDFSNLKLIIAGNPFSEEIKNIYTNRIINLKEKERVIAHLRFIPSEDVWKYFMASDVIILPYTDIDHSGIVHLAYSFNKPIIATRVGDFEEIIENGKCGILLEKNDAQTLAYNIGNIFSDNITLTNMSEYIKKIVKPKYSWNIAAKKTIEIYHSLYN